MANSLEVRSPFLDYRLIEFSTRVPNNLKLFKGQSKYILRKAAKNYLPEAINNRTTKRGFSVPVSDWFREDYAEYAKSILLDKSFPLSYLFNFSGIELMLKRHKNHEYDYGPFIWYLLSFILWSKNNLS
jgi:asparagine synthase (glutamine-hydrolysing)